MGLQVQLERVAYTKSTMHIDSDTDETIPLNPLRTPHLKRGAETSRCGCCRVLLLLASAGVVLNLLLVLLALTPSGVRFSHPMLREAGRCVGYALFGPRLMGPLTNTKRMVPRFSAANSEGRPVRVAIIGTGLAGLVAANAFVDSNERSRGLASGSVNPSAAPEFALSIFKTSDEATGFDIGDLFYPSIPFFAGWRRLSRRHGLQHRGPIPARVRMDPEGAGGLNAALDLECSTLRRVTYFIRRFTGISRLFYGSISLRSLLWLHGLSDAFFVHRLYPTLRFVTAVTGEPAELLDASAFIALLGHIEGWVDSVSSLTLLIAGSTALTGSHTATDNYLCF